MKKKKLILPFVMVGLTAALGMAACTSGGQTSQGGTSKGSEATSEVTSEGEEETIVITAKDGVKEIQVGETLQLTASVAGVKWTSRAEEIATVDQNGLVTAVKEGTARIRAEKEGYLAGSFTVTVQKAPEKPAKAVIGMEDCDHYSPNDIWGMDLSAYGMGWMGPGDSPVEDNSGATPDGTSLGWLQAGCKETLTFTSDKAVKVEIGVSMAYNADVDLSAALSVKFNGKEISMSGVVCPGPDDGDTNNYYDFHTVSFGMVDLIAGNNVLEITMIGQGPNMDEFKVFTEENVTIAVVKPVQKEAIVVTPDSAELVVGDTQQLVTVTTGVTYESSDATVASVSDAGLVTALKAGAATITVSKEGMKKATVAVKVTAKPVAGQIVLEAEDYTIPEGSALQVETGTASSGGKSIGYFSQGERFQLEYTSDEAKEVSLVLVAAPCSLKEDYSGIAAMNLAEAMELKVNGEAISLAGKTLSEVSGWNFQNWEEVELGKIQLVKGLNTFEFNAIAQGPNVDCIKLLPEGSQGGEQPGGDDTNKLTVTFAAGNGTGEMAPAKVEAGEYTLPACSYTAPAGMVFAGWSIPAANWWEQAQIKQAGDKLNVTADVTVTATWLKESITVTFAAGDGTGSMDPVTMKPGELELPKCSFVAPGTKVFAGWSITTKNQWGGTQTQIKQTGEKITVSDDMTITASWKVNIQKTETVDVTNAVFFEAEEALIEGTAAQQAGQEIESNESSHGGKDVGYMAKGAKITFSFSASEAGRVRLVLMGRSASADWSNWQNPSYYDHALEGTTSIKVNDVAVDVTAKGFLGSDAKTSVQVDLGYVAVAAGTNTIVIEALEQAPNFDCIAIIGGTITISAVAAA